MDWNLSPEAWAGIGTGFFLFFLILHTGRHENKQRRKGRGYTDRLKNQQLTERRKP